MEHTGMHIGDGIVIHCSNGVEKGNMKGWTHFAVPVGLYSKEELGIIHPTLRKGDRGDEVLLAQRLLSDNGLNVGAIDGVYGTKTMAAVTVFQKQNGLKADGICGPATWAVLDAPKDTYSISITGATKSMLDRVLAICPSATYTKEHP